ncbi:nitroreductase family deazaflavin-dependent oxidoreductase [soil metagenome]
MNFPGTDQLWPVLLRVMGGHTKIYQVTNGRIGHRFPGSPPMLLLDHTGAKSGVERTSPLVYIADGEDLIIVASKGGYPKNPGWFYNLKANPDTTVQVGSELHKVHARVAKSSERERLWSLAVKTYKGYDGYQERTDREIPLVVLEPTAA